MVFQDETVTVKYNNNPTPGCAIEVVQIDGLQKEIKIIDQILDTLAPASGIVENTDTIIEFANKVVATLDTAYGVLNTSTSAQLTPLQRLAIVTTVGENIELPLSSAAGVIHATEYTVIFPTTELSVAGTLSVANGDSLNGVVDAVFNVRANATGNSPITIKSDGAGWWTC
jgi:hypothetical protein